MKNIRKGFLLNFAYEGSYIIFKLFIFCLCFYITQIWVGYSLLSTKAEIIDRTNGVYGEGYLHYSQLFNDSLMPYIFTAFMVASFFGIYYIFKKDKIGTNKINAIYTLPYPRYCNFSAKFFYCILCPLSVYAVQILVNMTIISFNVRNVGFRENELYLSSLYEGVYQTLFRPSPVFLFLVLAIITFATKIFVGYIEKSVAIIQKVPSLYMTISTIAFVIAINLMFTSKLLQNFWVYLYAISVCVISIIVELILAYRKVRI